MIIHENLGPQVKVILGIVMFLIPTAHDVYDAYSPWPMLVLELYKPPWWESIYAFPTVSFQKLPLGVF